VFSQNIYALLTLVASYLLCRPSRVDEDSELEGADDASLNSDDVADMVMGGSSDDGKSFAVCALAALVRQSCSAELVYFSADPCASTSLHMLRNSTQSEVNLIIHAELCNEHVGAGGGSDGLSDAGDSDGEGLMQLEEDSPDEKAKPKRGRGARVSALWSG
jgi:hypothetical protein